MKLKMTMVTLSLMSVSAFANAAIEEIPGRYQQILASGEVNAEVGRITIREIDAAQEIEMFARLSDARGRVCELNEIFEERDGSFIFNVQDKKLKKACSLSLFRTPRGRLILKELSKPGGCQDLCLDENADIGTRVFILERK